MRAVLLCSKNDLGHQVLRSLYALGFATQLIYDRRSAASVGTSRRHAGILLASDRLADEDPMTILRMINDAHCRSPIDVVIASDVAGTALLAKISDRLAPKLFPTPDLASLLTLNDKWLFYNLCRDLGLDAPRSAHFATKELIDPTAIEAAFHFPVVVKPVSQHGAIGFALIDGAADLETRILRNPQYGHPDLIVQEYIPGEDVGVSVLALGGRIQYWATFDCGNNWATRFRDNPKLLQLAERIVAATGFSGVANFDARLERGTGAIWLLECNPRFFARTTAARLCGIDFVKAGLAAIGLAQIEAPGACHGEFYSASDLFSGVGWTRLLAGRWPVRPMLRNLREIMADPLPFALRTLGFDAAA